MRRAAYAIGFVLAAGALTRLGGAVLPAQAAMVLAGITALGVPGWALLHASGLRARLDTVACLGLAVVSGLAVWAVALAVGVIVGLPFSALLVAVGIASMAGLARESETRPAPRLDIGLAVAGTTAVIILATRWQWSLYGDEVFHTGRIRKLLALDRLSLEGLSSYFHGPLHAGYAFPLLHAGQAAMTSLSGLDAGVAYPNMSPFFAGVFILVSYAAGRSLGGTWVGVAAALLAFSNSIPVHEPFLGMMQWPGPFAFYVLTTAAIVVLVELMRAPDRRLGIALAAVVAEVAIDPSHLRDRAAHDHPGRVHPVPIGLAIRCRSGDRSGGGARLDLVGGAARRPPRSAGLGLVEGAEA